MNKIFLLIAVFFIYSISLTAQVTEEKGKSNQEVKQSKEKLPVKDNKNPTDRENTQNVATNIEDNEAVIENFPNGGKIDWTEQIIKAKGWAVIDTVRFKNKTQAELMAERGATVVAQRNLLEIIQGVRIVSETTVRDCIPENDYVYSRLDGIIKGAEMLGEPIVNRGKVEVTLFIPMYKPSANSSENESIATVFQKKLSTTPGLIKTATSETSAQDEINPSMLPVIMDEQGNIVADYTKYIDPKTGKFPKWLNLSKNVMEEVGLKEGVDIIDGVQNSDGTIKIEPGQLDKMDKWSKIGKGAIKVGKLLLMLI